MSGILNLVMTERLTCVECEVERESETVEMKEEL